MSIPPTAIVSGGCHGAGRELARALAARQFAVALAYLPDQDEAERTVADAPGPLARRDTKQPAEVSMSITETTSGTPLQAPEAGTVDFKLEVVILPVSDVDRAKRFYASLGWREDADFPIREDFRVIQMTPPGSGTSIIFGDGVSGAEPGSAGPLVLAVYDIGAAHADLVARGAEVSDVFHGPSGFDLNGTAPRETGPDPDGQSYKSWISFSDPDGNRWLVQEIKTRLPGR